jgi:cyclophilin family peptidyl-prolyl cis-trans isomerase
MILETRLVAAVAAAWIVCGLHVALAQTKPVPARPAATKPAVGKPPAAAPTIVLETVKGTIEIETYPEDAPKTVARILELIKKNFYNGLRFHRIEKHLVQVGDPASRDMSREASWGRTGSGTSIGAVEITKRRRHVAGAVAMAHAGDPTFADSQFYIVKRAVTELDGKYTVFGRVTRGLDVVAKLEKADILKRASVKP